VVEDDQPLKVTRVIDFRIPLPWLLSGLILVGWALVSMWFSLNQLVRDVADLQITVKAGNGQAVTIAGEIALLRYRVENLEADKRLPRQQPMTGGRQ
jgi:hypothetical protein